MQTIRAEDEYAGVRATIPAQVGTARLVLQIDMGVGDVVSPAPALCAFPTLLDFPAPRILPYPKQAVIAEKFDAMIILGERNSRIKDFFDIYHLAGHFEFDREMLGHALTRADSGVLATYRGRGSRGLCRGVFAAPQPIPDSAARGSAEVNQSTGVLVTGWTLALTAQGRLESPVGQGHQRTCALRGGRWIDFRICNAQAIFYDELFYRP